MPLLATRPGLLLSVRRSLGWAPGTAFPSRLRALLASALAASWLFSAGPVAAAAWEVHTNANHLTSVAAIGPYVWAPSAFGLHRFDPQTGTFVRYFREPAGLVSNSITAVRRDTSGVLWIGTQDHGVSLLDQSGRWSSVTTLDGLPSDAVTALEPYRDGMWIGTDRGLALFVGTTIEAIYPDGVNPSPFRSDAIRDVETFGGRTWVATADGVHSTTDGVAWDTTIAGLANRDVRSLAFDGTRLWAVAADRSVYSGGESGTWVETESGLPGTNAARVRATGGALYVTTTTGVYRWDPLGATWNALGGPNAVDIEAAANGTLWAGGVDGLWSFDGSAWRQFLSEGPAGNWVHGMALQGGTVYMATRDGGVARHDDTRGWRNFVGGGNPDTSLLEGTFVFSALVDRDGSKWFGDWSNSIARLDDSSEPPHFQNFFRDSVQFTFAWSSAHDPQGPIWFGLDTGCRGCGPGTEPQGLIRINPNLTVVNYLPTNSGMTNSQVRAIAFAPDGTMWVGYADGGVDLFANGVLASTLRHLGVADGLRQENVWGIVFDGSEALVLTDGGVTRFTTNGALVQVAAGGFLTPSISANGAVNPIALDAQGGVWVATKSGLLHRPPGGLSEVFNVSNSPLVSNDVHSVVVDRTSGDVWIGTGEGVNRLRPSELGGPTGATSSRIDFTPNPIRMSVAGLRFVARSADGSLLVRTRIEVLDLGGRVLARLRSDGNGEVFWRAETTSGRALAAGVYFLRAVSVGGDGAEQTLAKGRLVLVP